MQFMGDAAWWDSRFAARERPLAPDAALIRDIGRLRRGSALDIACGDGRNALYLAQNGFRMTGVDFCESALNRFRGFAQQRGLIVQTRLMDLSLQEEFSKLGDFDTVIINHYRISAHIASVLPGYVTAGGRSGSMDFTAFPRPIPG